MACIVKYYGEMFIWDGSCYDGLVISTILVFTYILMETDTGRAKYIFNFIQQICNMKWRSLEGRKTLVHDHFIHLIHFQDQAMLSNHLLI